MCDCFWQERTRDLTDPGRDEKISVVDFKSSRLLPRASTKFIMSKIYSLITIA